MPTYNLTDQESGKKYKVTADNPEAAVAAFKKMQGGQTSQEQPKQERGWQDYVRDGLAAVNQGLSFGFADEIVSAGGAPLRAYQEDIGLLDAYRKNQEEQKQNREGFREDSPWMATGLEMAGAIPTGIAGANALLGRTALGTAAPLTQSAGLGLLEGGAYGMGTADEGERMEGTMKGGALGMVMGPAATKGVDLIGKGVKAGARGVTSRLTDTPRIEAERGIRSGLLREFDDVDDAVTAYSRTSGDGMLVDVSDSILDTTKGALRTPDSDARKIVQGAMNQRQSGQQSRLLGASADNLGVADARTSREMLETVIEERQRQAGPLYEAAYQQNVPVTGKLFDLMDRPALQTAQKGANRLLKEEGIDPATLFRNQEKAIGGRLAIGDGNSTQSVNVRYIDYLKRALDDQYQSVKNRFPQKARAILKTKQELLKEVDDRVPEYAQARQTFSDAKTLEDAQDLGRNIFSRKEDVFDIEDRVAAMTESEKMMFRAGVMEEVTKKVESAGETQNSVSRLLRSTEMKNRLRQAFDSDEQFEKFVDQAGMEDMFSRNRNYLNTRGGSQTDLLATSEGVLSDAVSPEGPGTTMMNVIGKLLGKEVAPETKEEFVRIATDNSMTEGQLRALLTAPDPVVAIDRLELPQSAKARLSGLLGLEAGVLAESQ